VDYYFQWSQSSFFSQLFLELLLVVPSVFFSVAFALTALAFGALIFSFWPQILRQALSQERAS